MRIRTIELSWFRGAADSVPLELNLKSIVAYGENGSGKSSFVDALEYVMNDGRINHLAHEYSGKRQEKGIPNTHKPEDEKTTVKIKFADNSELGVEIRGDGSSESKGGATSAIRSWDYRRTVLRQDEVAEFIHDRKGDKYSALLPLFGLHPLELAAENLRQLYKIIEQTSKLKENQLKLKEAEVKRKATFGTDSDNDIGKKIEDLFAKYCRDEKSTKAIADLCEELELTFDKRIKAFSADQRQYLALRDGAELDVKGEINVVNESSVKLAESFDPLITEKLDVLQSTGRFVNRLDDESEVECPACGRSIPVEAFQTHIRIESQRLQGLIDASDTRKAAIGTLCNTLRTLKSSMDKVDVVAWRAELAKGPLLDNFAFLDGLNIEALRTSCTAEALKTLARLVPLVEAAATASKEAPLDVQEIRTDQKTVQAGKSILAATSCSSSVARVESLLTFIRNLEDAIREEIRLRSNRVIQEISEDIKTMWTILHPRSHIEDVRLCVPEDADKAIDICLKFHGVPQDSPRLTLSEGYRNSLGLCIFLAMAKREADDDRPVFLDDVAVSFDRGHRGMIAELVEKEFTKRQVVILTHDRDWYTELRYQLDPKSWIFKTLLPYESPEIGIRWSHKTTNFGDARAHLRDRPDSAGNDARKIMDVELAIIAEKIQLRLPFKRAEKNDKRMAHEFLERLIADGKERFQKKADQEYVAHQDAIDALDAADRLLLSWGNKASHSFDIVRPEAEKLIDACDKALQALRCLSCGQVVWSADNSKRQWLQCECGEIIWRY